MFSRQTCTVSINHLFKKDVLRLWNQTTLALHQRVLNHQSWLHIIQGSALIGIQGMLI